MKRVEGIGLSGHMHSAILMDSTDKPIGNAILHNDVRAEKEAHELNQKFPDLAEKAGVIAMPGFTGPKLLWLSRNEPEKFKQAKYIIFAKDFLRLKLTGTIATDVTDAAGSWLFDQKKENGLKNVSVSVMQIISNCRLFSDLKFLRNIKKRIFGPLEITQRYFSCGRCW